MKKSQENNQKIETHKYISTKLRDDIFLKISKLKFDLYYMKKIEKPSLGNAIAFLLEYYEKNKKR